MDKHRVEKQPLEPAIYAREPLGFHGSIPLFSSPSEYTENYEKISGDHLDSMTTTGDNPFIEEALWTEMEASTVELVRKYSCPGDRILDVGVGLGRVLSQFPALRRYGVDISLGYLEQVQAKGIEVVYSVVEDMPFHSGVFDMVMCTDVLEHVFDLHCASAKILALLKPGGVFIVRVPYREDLEQYASPSNPYRFVHVRTFDEHSLRLHFGTILGQNVLEFTYAGYLPSPARLANRCSLTDRLFLFGMRVLRRLRKTTYERLLRRRFLPIEVNVVIRKGTS